MRNPNQILFLLFFYIKTFVFKYCVQPEIIMADISRNNVNIIEKWRTNITEFKSLLGIFQMLRWVLIL